MRYAIRLLGIVTSSASVSAVGKTTWKNREYSASTNANTSANSLYDYFQSIPLDYERAVV